MDAGNGGKPGRSSGVCRNCYIIGRLFCVPD